MLTLVSLNQLAVFVKRKNTKLFCIYKFILLTVSRWLNGERDPSIETLNKIAKALDTSASYFFIDDSRQNENKMPEEKSDSVNWGAILAGTALTATAVIGIVALAKAMGKLNEKDTEQIEDILNRK